MIILLILLHQCSGGFLCLSTGWANWTLREETVEFFYVRISCDQNPIKGFLIMKSFNLKENMDMHPFGKGKKDY